MEGCMKTGFAVAALALAALAPAPLSAEVAETAASGFVTRDMAVVGAEPQAVWLELISPANWWNDAHTWSGDAANMSLVPQGGGCFCERIPPEDSDGAIGLAGSVQHMVVLQAYPRKVLRMRGALGPLQSEPVNGVLTVTLKPVKGGTRILWEYVVGGHMRYPAETIAKAVDGVMSQQLDGLAARLGRIDDPEARQKKAKPAPAKPPANTKIKPAVEKPKPPSESAIGDDFLDDNGDTDPG
ncbi:MAG: SRPBCC family protein [Sphingomonadaceae bacterium]|nr:MAG: SRPBCC family protein [Sphingomonadaceae bacterium]